jgi:hypothetical protein
MTTLVIPSHHCFQGTTLSRRLVGIGKMQRRHHQQTAGYAEVHLIAHSAGTGFVTAVQQRLCVDRSQHKHRHQYTYLDAFISNDVFGVEFDIGGFPHPIWKSAHGKWSDFSDQLLHTGTTCSQAVRRSSSAPAFSQHWSCPTLQPRCQQTDPAYIEDCWLDSQMARVLSTTRVLAMIQVVTVETV